MLTALAVAAAHRGVFKEIEAEVVKADYFSVWSPVAVFHKYGANFAVCLLDGGSVDLEMTKAYMEAAISSGTMDKADRAEKIEQMNRIVEEYLMETGRTIYDEISEADHAAISERLDRARITKDHSVCTVIADKSAGGYLKNPIPRKILLAINAAYLFSIALIFIEDLRMDKKLRRRWSRCWMELKQKLKPKPKDTRFKEFVEICRTGEGKETLRRLMEDSDFNPNQREADSGNTGLHFACLNQNVHIVQALLDHRRAKHMNINVENSARETPLMLAAATGNRVAIQ